MARDVGTMSTLALDLGRSRKIHDGQSTNRRCINDDTVGGVCSGKCWRLAKAVQYGLGFSRRFGFLRPHRESQCVDLHSSRRAGLQRLPFTMDRQHFKMRVEDELPRRVVDSDRMAPISVCAL